MRRTDQMRICLLALCLLAWSVPRAALATALAKSLYGSVEADSLPQGIGSLVGRSPSRERIQNGRGIQLFGVWREEHRTQAAPTLRIQAVVTAALSLCVPVLGRSIE